MGRAQNTLLGTGNFHFNSCCQLQKQFILVGLHQSQELFLTHAAVLLNKLMAVIHVNLPPDILLCQTNSVNILTHYFFNIIFKTVITRA